MVAVTSTPRDSRDVLTDPPPPDADARVPYGPEPLQFGDLRLPAGPGRQPLVAVVHGGYWQAIYNLTHAGHLCVDLAHHAIATWNVEYRRIGDPGGGWPACLTDVVAAVDHIGKLASAYAIDPGRVVVVGHSAGGQLALLAASRIAVPIRAVVSLGGVVDLHWTHHAGDDNGLIARLLGGPPGDVPQRWLDASPRAHVPLGIRYVLACGTQDAHWTPNVETAAAARAAGDDAELLPLPDAGHFELIDPRARAWATVQERLQSLLR